MNKTVVLLHLVVSSILTKPIDEVRVSNDENASSLLNTDDLLNSSEMVRMNGAQNLDSASHRFEETENKNLVAPKSIRLQRDKSDDILLESESSSEQKTVKEVESSTINIDREGRTVDYLEDLANEKFELYNNQAALGGELERIHIEYGVADAESNTEWNMLDDVPIHRRMINPQTTKVEEMSALLSNDDNSKSSSSSESKSVEENDSKSSSSSESKSLENDSSKSSNSKSLEDDKLSKNIKKDILNFKFKASNDEPNSEWDKLDDSPISRRMLNPKTMEAEEIMKRHSKYFNSKSSSSSESKSVEDNKSKSSSSSESKSVEDNDFNSSSSSRSKSLENGKLSKNIKKEMIHFKFKAPNDDPKAEWDKLDDYPIYRRRINPKIIKTEEIIKRDSKDSNSKSSSSSESKSVEDVNSKSSSSSESKSLEEDNLSKSNEKEIIHIEIEVPKNKSNTEWSMLSDIPFSRRMLNPKNIKVQEITIPSPKDYKSKSSSSPESKSSEDTSKSSKIGSHYGTSRYGNKESKEIKTDINVEKDHIYTDDLSMILKKELLAELMANKNAEKENSNSVENENIHARVNERKSLDALKQGAYHVNNDAMKMPKAYENYRPRVLHNHAPKQVLYRNQAVQYKPTVPVNPVTVASPGINPRTAIVPDTLQQHTSKESLAKSLESAESKTVDNFNYKRDSNAYPYTPDPNKTNYIYSKLLEASENAHMHRNGGISPRYVPINNLKVQYGLPNPNTYKYPPNIRPFSMPS